jgi:ABC-type transport system substrate-binding protein
VAAALAAAALVLPRTLDRQGGEGTSAPPDTRPPRQGGTLTMAMLAPRSLDPAQAETRSERVLAANLFDGLTQLGPHADVTPAVATAWRSDAQQRHWEFTLDPDARYADGTPVTAADFVTAWGRAGRSPRRSVRALLANLEGATAPGDSIPGVTATDEHTLSVQLVEPDADFPARVADPALAPVPRAAAANPDAWARQPLGNGPFTLQRSAPDVLTLTPNPHYAGDRPYLDSVQIRAVPDELTAWIAVQEGEAQFAPVPPEQLPAARDLYGQAEDPRVDAGVISTPLAALDVLAFDTSSPPLNDRRYRLAVALAINRSRLAAGFAGTRVPADGAVPDGVRSTAGAACRPCDHDPDRARQLLGELGAAPPLALAVGDTPAERAIARQIRSDLASVGIQTSFRASPAGQPAPGAATLTTAAAPAGLALTTFLSSWYDPLTPTSPTDGATTSLLTQAASTPAERDRLKLARRAQEQLESDAVVAPLLEHRQHAVLAPGIQGFTLTPDNQIDLAAISLTD